jgi:hypothetical protein
MNNESKCPFSGSAPTTGEGTAAKQSAAKY